MIVAECCCFFFGEDAGGGAFVILTFSAMVGPAAHCWPGRPSTQMFHGKEIFRLVCIGLWGSSRAGGALGARQRVLLMSVADGDGDKARWSLQDLHLSRV